MLEQFSVTIGCPDRSPTWTSPESATRSAPQLFSYTTRVCSQCRRSENEKPELGLETSRITSKSTLSRSWQHWRCVTPQLLAHIAHEENLIGFAFLPPSLQFRIRRALLRGTVDEGLAGSASAVDSTTTTTIPQSLKSLGTTKTLSILNHFLPLRKPTEQPFISSPSPVKKEKSIHSSRSPSPAPSEMSNFEAPFATDFLKFTPICPTSQKQLAQHNEKLKLEEMARSSVVAADDDGDGDENGVEKQTVSRKRGRPKGRRTSVKDRVTWVVVNIEEEEKEKKLKEKESVIIKTDKVEEGGRALRARNRSRAGDSVGRSLRPTLFNLSSSEEEGTEIEEESDETVDDSNDDSEDDDHERVSRKKRRQSAPTSSSEPPHQVPRRRGRPRKVIEISTSPVLTSDDEPVVSKKSKPTEPCMADSSYQRGNLSTRRAKQLPVRYAEDDSDAIISSDEGISSRQTKKTRIQIALPTIITPNAYSEAGGQVVVPSQTSIQAPPPRTQSQPQNYQVSMLPSQRPPPSLPPRSYSYPQQQQQHQPFAYGYLPPPTRQQHQQQPYSYPSNYSAATSYQIPSSSQYYPKLSQQPRPTQIHSSSAAPHPHPAYTSHYQHYSTAPIYSPNPGLQYYGQSVYRDHYATSSTTQYNQNEPPYHLNNRMNSGVSYVSASSSSSNSGTGGGGGDSSYRSLPYHY
ncbi:hypothetical protein BDR26DRAFT_921926 [Obelidium mucronatum]|nr:hypothetical protein BDR26DRAFT_921926 [Obelidium mucronatum]